jgi:hypothetical protein
MPSLMACLKELEPESRRLKIVCAEEPTKLDARIVREVSEPMAVPAEMKTTCSMGFMHDSP